MRGLIGAVASAFDEREAFGDEDDRLASRKVAHPLHGQLQHAQGSGGRHLFAQAVQPAHVVRVGLAEAAVSGGEDCVQQPERGDLTPRKAEPLDLLDGRVEQPFVGRQLLSDAGVDAGLDQRDQVVGLHLLLDEAPERYSRRFHVQPRDAEVVDDQHDGTLHVAAREPSRACDGRGGRGRCLRRKPRLRRDLHRHVLRERDWLNPAALTDFEIVGRQVVDDVAVAIGDDHIHANGVDADAESWRLWWL